MFDSNSNEKSTDLVKLLISVRPHASSLNTFGKLEFVQYFRYHYLIINSLIIHIIFHSIPLSFSKQINSGNLRRHKRRYRKSTNKKIVYKQQFSHSDYTWKACKKVLKKIACGKKFDPFILSPLFLWDLPRYTLVFSPVSSKKNKKVEEFIFHEIAYKIREQFHLHFCRE